jgi:hypothetical protein
VVIIESRGPCSAGKTGPRGRGSLREDRFASPQESRNALATQVPLLSSEDEAPSDSKLQQHRGLAFADGLR